MKKLNIVIVTYNWPPRNAIGTHRPYAWARYWSEAGARVVVLTAWKLPFDEPLDLDLPLIPGVDVIEVARGGGLAGIILKSERVRRIARKVKAWLRKGGNIGMDPRMSWRGYAHHEAKRLAANADIVVSTHGPASSHLIGYDMKASNPNIFWVADYRDLWSQGHIDNISDKARARIREVELTTVGASADLLTAVSEDMVEKLTTLTGIETLCVPNGFDINEKLVRQYLSTPFERLRKPVRIVYTGMIYEGHRDPTPLLDALAGLCSQGKIDVGDVTIDFYGARVDLAKRLAEKSAYAPFIRLMGHVTRDEALFAQRSASLLLLLESSAAKARGVLTGKLFEYMTTGRPILCIGSRPEYEIGNVLRKTGTGRVFGPDEYESLGDVLLETFSGKGLYQEYAPNIDEVLKYSRKIQAENFMLLLTKRIECEAQ
jgi:glycosyltransferase involved in cell wall biosynthesis